MKLSLCITHFNRFEMLVECFKQIIEDPRIDEIVISDDASDLFVKSKIIFSSFDFDSPKVKLFFNKKNEGCYRNKMISVSHATNDFCIVFDSDNIIDESYLDALEAIGELDKLTIYAPDFARPHFCFTHFAGKTVTKENIKTFIPDLKFATLINCMNYVVNRDEYLRVFDPSFKEPYAADSIIQNYNWFNAGNKMMIVPGMTYFHRVHDGSHFKEHQHKSMILAGTYEEKLKQLS